MSAPSLPSESVGLLAGAGRFPITFAEKARAVGLPVVGVGLRGHADPCLERLCWRFSWAGVARVSSMIRAFKRHGARRLVMAGKVHKADILYRPWKVLQYLPD